MNERTPRGLLGLVFVASLAWTGCASEAGLSSGESPVTDAPEDGEAEGDEAPIGQAASELIGGVQVEANIRTPTVLFRSSTNLCTGTRIGPRHILTAAHCVTDASGIVLPEYRVGRLLSVTNDKVLEGSVSWQSATIERTRVHPTWVARCGAMDNCSTNDVSLANALQDIAVLVLEDALPAGASWPQAQIDLGAVTTATTVTMMGYGCEQTYGGPAPSPRRMKRYLTNPVPAAQVNVPDVVVPPATMPLFQTNMVLTPGRTYPSPTGAGLCPGDSGGPLYRGSGLSRRVVAVHAAVTFGDNNPTLPRVNAHAKVSSTGTEAWLRGFLPAASFY